VSLFKRGEVWWSYRYIHGVRQQQSTGTTNRRQAETVEQKFKLEDNARRHQLVEFDSNLTVAALIARFIADAEPKPHHLFQIHALLPFFGDVAVMRLHKGMAREFRQYRHKQKTIKDSTVNRALSVLRHILYWAVDELIIPANPLTRLKLAPERRDKRKVISLEEEGKLLVAASDYLRRVIVTALDTGMRRGELLGQDWRDVDLSRKVLAVTKSKTVQGEGREIPLTHRVYQLLLEIRKDGGAVFTYKDAPFSNIRKGWLGALKRASLRHIRFHDTRHTFNTRLMEAGVMQEVRMALMGHSSGSRVNSIYTHIELPIKREAIQKLETWVATQKQNAKGGTVEDRENESVSEVSPDGLAARSGSSGTSAP